MYCDKARVILKSGKGGDGHVSFRREKYVTNGGPDGGDGGKGGDVILKVDKGLNTLIDFRNVRKYAAGNGENGGKKNCRGKDGEDIVLKVPEGTVVREAESGKVIIDMSGERTEYTILKGGKGGLGNQHFATSTMQAPKYAQPGQPSLEIETLFELKVASDVGLVGFPNAGKSSLLASCTNAKPKIAGYQFTTLSPNLGVVDLGGRQFVISDIPGLIEGASDGLGLGFEFLRHVERCKIFIFVVDTVGTEGRDPLEDMEILDRELSRYDATLLDRPRLIAANKSDLFDSYDCSEANLKALRDKYEPQGVKVFTISAATGNGIPELLRAANELLETLPKEVKTFEQEYDPAVSLKFSEEPFTVYFDEEEDEYVIEGPRIEKMLGYTNLDSEKGFAFFQRFLKDNGMLDMLEELGIKDGDTVRLYGHSFEYYK